MCNHNITENTQPSPEDYTEPKSVVPSDETKLKTKYTSESASCDRINQPTAATVENDGNNAKRLDEMCLDKTFYLNPVGSCEVKTLPLDQRDGLNSNSKTVGDQPPLLPERNKPDSNLLHTSSYKGLGYSKIDTIFNTEMKINGLAVTHEDDLIVVSNNSRKCVVYDKSGVRKNEIIDKIISPWDAACTTTATGIVVYVTDIGKEKGDGSVKKYRLDGTFIKLLVTKLCKPHGVALSKSGELFVCDTGENCMVLVFSPNGKKLKTIKTHNRNDRFICPWYVATSPDGDLIISDFGAGKLIVLDKSFKKKTTLKPASSDIEVNTFKPAMCFTDDAMNVYAVDQKSNFIFMWSKDGIMRTLEIPNECRVNKPLGIAIDSCYRIVIASHSGSLAKITVDAS